MHLFGVEADVAEELVEKQNEDDEHAVHRVARRRKRYAEEGAEQPNTVNSATQG